MDNLTHTATITQLGLPEEALPPVQAHPSNRDLPDQRLQTGRDLSVRVKVKYLADCLHRHDKVHNRDWREGDRPTPDSPHYLTS